MLLLHKEGNLVKTNKLVAIALAMLLMMTVAIAGAEETDRETQINQYIDTLKNEQSGKVEWEPRIANKINPAYENATPGQSDIDQEKALYIAIDTILTLTDKTIEDLAVYNVWFYFQRETVDPSRSFWTVCLEWPIEMLGNTYDYYVSISSPDGYVIKFEIPPLNP